MTAPPSSSDLRRPCGPLPPCLRHGDPSRFALLAHALTVRSLRCSSAPSSWTTWTAGSLDALDRSVIL